MEEMLDCYKRQLEQKDREILHLARCALLLLWFRNLDREQNALSVSFVMSYVNLLRLHLLIIHPKM